MIFDSRRWAGLTLALLSASALGGAEAFAEADVRKAETTAGAYAAEECALSAPEIFKRVAPSVVRVLSFGANPFKVVGRIRAQTGSGIIVAPDLVATNFHTLIDAQVIAVSVGESVLEATQIGLDPILDIAVLQVPGVSTFGPPIEYAPEGGPVVGDDAYVIGFPTGVDKSIAAGIISGIGRVIPLNTSSWLSPYLQTDAAVSPGNSGGPLLDRCGRMLGMVSLQSAHPRAENIGFAIPSATLIEVLPQLIESGEPARPWHGLYGQMVTPTILGLLGIPPSNGSFTTGFLVETVEPGSAADKAGIQGGFLPVTLGMQEMLLGGDIIVSVDGQPIRSLEDAMSAVSSLEIGQAVNATLLRDGEIIDVSAMIERRPVLPQDLEIYR